MTISAFSDELAQVRTKKKEFLSQIERIVPWGEWLAMIQPCYYRGNRQPRIFGVLRRGFQQSGSGRGYSRPIPESADPERTAEEAVCSGGSSAHGAWTHSEEGDHCGFHHHFCSIFH